MITSGKVESAENITKNLEQDIGIKVHRTTVSRLLHLARLGSSEKQKKPKLSSKNIK